MEGAREQQGRVVGGMSGRASSWLAWSVCTVTVLILAFSLLLIVLGWPTPLPQGWTPWRDQAVSLVGLIGVPILGGLIASRRPENLYGWLWLGFGLGLTLQLLGGALCCLRAGGGAGIAARSPNYLPRPRARGAAGAHLRTLPLAALSHGAAAVAALASPGLDLDLLRSGAPGLELLVCQAGNSRGGDHCCDRIRRSGHLRCLRPLGALARGPLSPGERVGAPTAEVVRVGRSPGRCLSRRIFRDRGAARGHGVESARRCEQDGSLLGSRCRHPAV